MIKFKLIKRGEMADDIINGVFCQVCGDYMGEGNGFPVTCGGCR